MFNKQQIDFLGFPICPIEDVALKEVSEQGIPYPAPKIFWFCLNVNHFPFNHLKMRQAFGHALNRERIKKIFPYHKKFAFTPLPLIFTYHLDADFLIREDEKKAKALFDEGLEEMGMKTDDFPVVYISFAISVLMFSLKFSKASIIACILEMCASSRSDVNKL